jgi:hypothetical protein
MIESTGPSSFAEFSHLPDQLLPKESLQNQKIEGKRQTPHQKMDCRATRRRFIANQSQKIPPLEALPPHWQTHKEQQAIRRSDAIHTLLQGEKIESIAKIEGGYFVFTETFKLEVKICYQPQEMPGPAKFELNPQEAQIR